MDKKMATAGQRQLPTGVTYDSTQLTNFSRWADGENAVLHAWMDQTWFTNMWEGETLDSPSCTPSHTPSGFPPLLLTPALPSLCVSGGA
jgi:hypothetical protein